MYEKNKWKDHIVDIETGEVLQQGTLQDAEHFNHMEKGIYDAHENMKGFLLRQKIEGVGSTSNSVAYIFQFANDICIHFEKFILTSNKGYKTKLMTYDEDIDAPLYDVEAVLGGIYKIEIKKGSREVYATTIENGAGVSGDIRFLTDGLGDIDGSEDEY